MDYVSKNKDNKLNFLKTLHMFYQAMNQKTLVSVEQPIRMNQKEITATTMK